MATVTRADSVASPVDRVQLANGHVPYRGYAVLIVHRPPGWMPKSPADVPPTLEFSYVDWSAISLRLATRLSIRWNRESIINGGDTWAMPMRLENELSDARKLAVEGGAL